MKKLPKIISYFKKDTFIKLSRFFFYAFVFLLPFQINVIVYASPLYTSGNFNPYTSHFIFLADIVFLLALIFWGAAYFKNEYKEKITYGNPVIFILFFIFLLFSEISVLFAEDMWLAFNIFIRFIEAALVYFFVINKVVKLDVIINVFIASVSVQAFIAIFQYLKQGSIGLHFLGEPHISPQNYGIAKINIDQKVLIRPYGTFAHPNILAGYLLTGILLTFQRIRIKEYIGYPLIFLQAAAFILAFSRGAFLALLIAFLVYISVKESRISFKYILLILSLFIFFAVLFNFEQTIISRLLFTDIQSFTERVQYFNISKQIFYTYPFGTGLGNFTILMPDFAAFKLDPWLYQPVHNIYMLLLNEIGIFGVISFLGLFLMSGVFIFSSMKKTQSGKKELGAVLLSLLAAVFVLGLFDHYLVSLHQGLMLLFLVFAISGKYIISAKNH